MNGESKIVMPKEPAEAARFQVSSFKFQVSLFWLLLALAVLPLMVSNDSLWLDEGDTAMYALPPDFHSWCDKLRHDGQADCQMPLAMLAAWAGGKMLGTQEWQMRAVNLLWGALAVLGMWRVGRRWEIPWLPLLLVVQPFFWFYLNEARPYALQMAGGTGLLVALAEFQHAKGAGTGWAWWLAGSAVFLFCGTLLAPLPVGATVLAGAWLAWRQGWLPGRKAVLVLAGGAAACVPVAVYYLGTLARGAKGAQLWSVDLKFFAYVVYEFTGMGGLGLSGDEIRDLARSPHLHHDLLAALPSLLLPLLVAVLLAAVFFFGLRQKQKPAEANAPLAWGLAGILVLVAAVFIGASLALQKAFWARHFSPVFPFYVALLGLAFSGCFAAGRWPRWLPLLLGGLLLWSALDFRFAPSLRKEDYRSVAACVRPLVAEHKVVWWVAGKYLADYYGLAADETRPVAGKVFIAHVYGYNGGDLKALPPPDVIVYNKPYIHDRQGTVQAILEQGNYQRAAQFKLFTVWVRPPPGAPGK